MKGEENMADVEPERISERDNARSSARKLASARNSRRSAGSSLIGSLYDGLMIRRTSRTSLVEQLEDLYADSLADDLQHSMQVEAFGSERIPTSNDPAANNAANDPDSSSSVESPREGALDKSLPNLLDGASSLAPVKDQDRVVRASVAIRECRWSVQDDASVQRSKPVRLTDLWATRDERDLHAVSFTGAGQKSFMASASELMLKCAGVIPVCAGVSGYVYPVFAILFSFFCAGLFIRTATASSDYEFWSGMMAAVQASGMGCALAMLHMSRIDELMGPKKTPLKHYAIQNRFYSEWISAIPFDAMASVSLFVICTIVHISCPEPFPNSCTYRRLSLPGWHLILSLIWTDFVFATILFAKVHISRVLEMMVDDFSCQYVEHKDVCMSFVEWNRIQSILNRSAKRLENSYVVLLTVLIMGLGPIAADVLIGLSENREGTVACSGPSWNWLAQHVLVSMGKFAGMFVALGHCAKVSRECKRTKCFINSLFDGRRDILRAGRSKLVRYIDDSNAGFCIFGVKVTSFALMKGVYLLGAFIFALGIQAVNKYGG